MLLCFAVLVPRRCSGSRLGMQTAPGLGLQQSLHTCCPQWAEKAPWGTPLSVPKGLLARLRDHPSRYVLAVCPVIIASVLICSPHATCFNFWWVMHCMPPPPRFCTKSPYCTSLWVSGCTRLDQASIEPYAAPHCHLMFCCKFSFPHPCFRTLPSLPRPSNTHSKPLSCGLWHSLDVFEPFFSPAPPPSRSTNHYLPGNIRTQLEDFTACDSLLIYMTTTVFTVMQLYTPQ